MNSDADLPPTQVNLPPTEPVRTEAAVVREPLVPREAPVDPLAYEPIDPAWFARVDDRLRSLQTMMALVGLVAVAALGLSIYALIHDKPSNDGASQQHVADIDSRVSRLEATAPTSGTTNDLASQLSQKANVQDVQKLSGRVAGLQAAVGKNTTAVSSATGSIGQLKGSVGQLTTQVNQLSQQVANGSPQATTTTTTP